jgi:hypothetical protein
MGMANTYLVSHAHTRFHPEHQRRRTASFDEIVRDGELAQLKAKIQEVIASNWHDGVFEMWWSDTGARRHMFGATYGHNDDMLRALLAAAHEDHNEWRRHGHPTMRSIVYTAWTWLRSYFYDDLRHGR